MAALATLALASVLLVYGQNLIQRWATTYETHLGAGFDSNVVGARENEIEDEFVSALQSVKLSRVNSLTQLDFLGSISGTAFPSQGDASYLDGGWR